MGPEFVTVKANGKEWTAFKRVQVRASFTEAARTFQIEIAAEATPGEAAAAFRAGTLIEIEFSGDLVFTGYVDRYQPKLGHHNQAEISVSGRSKSQDAIDSSALHKTGRFEGKTTLQIMDEVLGYSGVDVKVKTDQKLDKVPHYQINPGETVFRLGEKMLRAQGLQMTGDVDGSIKITKVGSDRHAGGLVEGENIQTIEADHNWSGRHSKVIVRGQRPFGHGPGALEVEATAEDNSVGRARPVVVYQDEDTDNKRAKTRAEHRRDREAGNAIKATVGTQGFRDEAGKLWTPGFTVWTESPFADIAQDMAIESVTWEQVRNGDSGGSTSAIAVVDPRALGGKKGKGGKAGKDWNTDAGGDGKDTTPSSDGGAATPASPFTPSPFEQAQAAGKS